MRARQSIRKTKVSPGSNACVSLVGRSFVRGAMWFTVQIPRDRDGVSRKPAESDGDPTRAPREWNLDGIGRLMPLLVIIEVRMVEDFSPNHLRFGLACVGIGNAEARPRALEWPSSDKLSVALTQVPEANEDHKVLTFFLEGSDRNAKSRRQVLGNGSLLQAPRRRPPLLRTAHQQHETDEER